MYNHVPGVDRVYAGVQTRPVSTTILLKKYEEIPFHSSYCGIGIWIRSRAKHYLSFFFVMVAKR